MAENRNVDSYNRTMAGNNGYVETKLTIKKTDEETRNVISNTFGRYIKNNLDALWVAVGLDPNVNIAYQKTMTDPNACIDAGDKKYYPHPGVGNLRAYNEAGNPAGGCFTMQAIG